MKIHRVRLSAELDAKFKAEGYWSGRLPTLMGPSQRLPDTGWMKWLKKYDFDLNRPIETIRCTDSDDIEIIQLFRE